MRFDGSTMLITVVVILGIGGFLIHYAKLLRENEVMKKKLGID